MWCDTFDADLLKVVPGAAEALGDTADIRMQTYSTLTGGKINCPSAWWTDHGLTSFFWTASQFRPPESYITDHPVAECTFLEVARDEWVHGAVVCMNRRIIWRPPQDLQLRLMYDIRSWTILSAVKREKIQEDVRQSLEAAAGRLQLALEGVAELDADG